jgi:hypothetical protein
MKAHVQIRDEHGGEILYDQIIDWEDTPQCRSLNATLRDALEQDCHIEIWREYNDK